MGKGSSRCFLYPVSRAIGGWWFLHDAGELAGEVGLVGEAAIESDLGEGSGGADDEVAGFLDAEVTQVFLRRHIEAGFEFTKEAAQRKVGCFGEFGDGDVFAVAFVKELEGGA